MDQLNLKNDWATYKLTELGTLGRGKSKHRPRDASFLYGGNFPFIQTGDVKNANHKIFSFSQTYSEAGLAQSKLWDPGTLCITIAANIADTGILTFPACFPDSVIGFVADSTKCDVEFIEYLLQFYQRQIQSHSIGSVQENINLGTFQNIEFQIPNLPTQRRIGEILSALDDKIELNRQINQTLEQMAQTLFRKYFLDSTIEENQELISLLDFANLIGGGTPKTSLKEYWDGTILWVSAKDVTPNDGTFIVETEKKITLLGLSKSSAKLLPQFSTIITARGTVGKVCVASVEMAISQSNYALKAKNDNTDFVLFQIVQNTIEELQRNSYGTVFDTITTNTLRDIKIAVPPQTKVLELEEKLNPLYMKILSNLKENIILSKTRDSLLPKLMSGEIDVMQTKPEALHEQVLS